jgi:hypothetical protein
MPVDERIKNVQQDMPDDRDWIYQPALIQLEKSVPIPDTLKILDQKSEGACTGFAVAAVINRLYALSNQDIAVSPRMLYEMAKRHDEWPGEDYDGSSLRGVIHAWKNMGVCQDTLWPYKIRKKGDLTIARAKDAKNHSIGAYYRLKPSITDFHTALNEVGIIAVSANVHKGWDNPQKGKIRHYKKPEGGHAFAVVGYNEIGFWVQNSWGPAWGDNGVALWTYEDWIANVMDAWVFRLALAVPQVFGMRPESSLLQADTGKIEKSTVPRSNIAGHFVHIDDGRYKTQDQYWSNPHDVEQTAELVAGSPKYKHLLIYAHGGLNSPKDSARRINGMKDVFKANDIYPFHIMYDTGIMEELKDLIFHKNSMAEKRVRGFRNWKDRFLEGLVRRPGTLLWDEMKQDAKDAMAQKGAGSDAINRFQKNFSKTGKKIKLHFVGHSTGAIVIGHFLKTFQNKNFTFTSCSLMAPACSIDLYKQTYLPVIQGKTSLKIENLYIYNLMKKLELSDSVGGVYEKSLLYLVSNAFERKKGKPLLGMATFKKLVGTAQGRPKFIYSNGVDGKESLSTSHGGFDNDPATMNNILYCILGKTPKEPFKKGDLDY